MSNESSSVIDYTNVLADLKARRVQLDTAIAAIEQLAGVPLSGTASISAINFIRISHKPLSSLSQKQTSEPAS